MCYVAVHQPYQFKQLQEHPQSWSVQSKLNMAESRRHNSSGMTPEKKFFEMTKESSEPYTKEPTSDGISPDIKLLVTFRSSKRDNRPISDGIRPVKLLFCIARVVRARRLPISLGRLPERRLSRNDSISRDSSWEKVVGILPFTAFSARASQRSDESSPSSLGIGPNFMRNTRFAILSILRIQTNINRYRAQNFDFQ